jgi:hypothetical protein
MVVGAIVGAIFLPIGIMMVISPEKYWRVVSSAVSRVAERLTGDGALDSDKPSDWFIRSIGIILTMFGAPFVAATAKSLTGA